MGELGPGAVAAAAATAAATLVLGICGWSPFRTCSTSTTRHPDDELLRRRTCRGQGHDAATRCGAHSRRHKVVRDLEWVWLSPNIFSAELEDCAGLCDSTAAAVAADPQCVRWLEQLDAAPAPLIEFLGHDPRLPLGFYFAKLLEYWLRCCPSLDVAEGSLRVNQPITSPNGGKTVGQLKYIFRCQAFRGRSSWTDSVEAPVMHHWEASVKFFLRAARTYTEPNPQTRSQKQEQTKMQSNAGDEARAVCSSDCKLVSCTPGSTADECGDRRRALRRAAGGSDPSKLAALLEEDGWDGPAIDSTADDSGKSAVHHAAWRGDIQNLTMLLDRGASTEAVATGEFSYGKTPLFFAITRSRDEVVKLLLERGASARIVNNKGQTPLSLGFSHLQDETLQMLRTHEEAELVPWRNFRLTHSDGLVYQPRAAFHCGSVIVPLCLLLRSIKESIFPWSRYGDLDPRFLDPTAEDVVTEYSVNPTTRLSRKGNFERNNSAVAAVARSDRNSFPRTAVVDALGECDIGAQASAADCCLGLYVGPSLHENLAWRVREAQRKMKLAQPGGVGYMWLQQNDSLIDTPKTGENESNKVEREVPDVAFICKGFLFEMLAPIELVGATGGCGTSRDATAGLSQLLPQPGVSVLCSAVSAEHSQGWWCEWPELKQRCELICTVESEKIRRTQVRWAVLTKRHWLAPAVARMDDLGKICVDGEEAVGIELLPTFTTAELAAQLQPHFEAIEINCMARPQPMLLACLLQQQHEDTQPKQPQEEEEESEEQAQPSNGDHSGRSHGVWVESTRGFVVVRGWSAQAAPMVSDGAPLVRKERDGQHDTMIAPDATGAVVVQRLTTERRPKKVKPVPKAVGPPEALVGMSGGADVLAVLRHALSNHPQPLGHSGQDVDDGHTVKKTNATQTKGARALRSNRELWRQQMKALLLGLPGGGAQAARFVWDCLCALDPSADKQERAVAGVLLDAFSDAILALLVASDVGPTNSAAAHVDTGIVGEPDLAGEVLRDLSETSLEPPATDDSWARAMRVRFALALVGETDEAAGYLTYPAGTEATGQLSEARTANEKAHLRWSTVLLQAGGSVRVARVAASLLLAGSATTLETGARLATKPGIAAALPLPLVTDAALALLKRGSFTLLALLARRLCDEDAVAGEMLRTELLSTAPPKSAQRLAAALGVETLPVRCTHTLARATSTAPGLSAGQSDVSAKTKALPWLMLSIPVALARTPVECEAAVRQLTASLPEAGGLRGVGLDTEWGDNSGDRPTCVLLQLATESHCVLVRLESVSGSGSRSLLRDRCPALTELLADSTVAKAGVGVNRDAALLESEWGLPCRSTVELSALAQAAGLVPTLLNKSRCLATHLTVIRSRGSLVGAGAEPAWCWAGVVGTAHAGTRPPEDEVSPVR